MESFESGCAEGGDRGGDPGTNDNHKLEVMLKMGQMILLEVFEEMNRDNRAAVAATAGADKLENQIFVILPHKGTKVWERKPSFECVWDVSQIKKK